MRVLRPIVHSEPLFVRAGQPQSPERRGIRAQRPGSFGASTGIAAGHSPGSPGAAPCNCPTSRGPRSRLSHLRSIPWQRKIRRECNGRDDDGERLLRYRWFPDRRTPASGSKPEYNSGSTPYFRRQRSAPRSWNNQMDTRDKCIDTVAWLKFRSNRAENAKPERLNLNALDREEG